MRPPRLRRRSEASPGNGGTWLVETAYRLYRFGRSGCGGSWRRPSASCALAASAVAGGAIAWANWYRSTAQSTPGLRIAARRAQQANRRRSSAARDIGSSSGSRRAAGRCGRLFGLERRQVFRLLKAYRTAGPAGLISKLERYRRIAMLTLGHGRDDVAALGRCARPDTGPKI